MQGQQVVDSCVAAIPAPDTSCNGIDEDCDGAADEGYAIEATGCGVGACWASGERSCIGGQVVNSCQAGSPSADTACDGVDQDCDGKTDEAYVTRTTKCGFSTCVRSGVVACQAGRLVDTCAPGTPATTDACNSTDDDCDGSIDEGAIVDDGDPCTTDSCTAQGPAHVPRADGLSCADGNACNGAEVCRCVSGQYNLLNPSFEIAPLAGGTGPDLLPADWTTDTTIPDTYSEDGSYGQNGGLVPGAAEGIRWVRLEANERIRQPLSAASAPGGITLRAQVLSPPPLRTLLRISVEGPQGSVVIGSLSGGSAWRAFPLFIADGLLSPSNTLVLQAVGGPILVDALSATTSCINTTCTAGLLLAAGTACDDGIACTGPGTCDAAQSCQPGAPVAPGSTASNDATCNGADDDCDGDLDEDFAASCDGAASVVCQLGKTRFASCSDANQCNGLEVCTGSACVPGVTPTLDVVCDGNDVDCDGQADEDWVPHCSNVNVRMQCVNGQETTTACGGNVCTGVKTCGGGVCTTTTPGLPIDDSNVCTSDFCFQVNGNVTHTPGPVGFVCDDYVACTTNDACDEETDCIGSAIIGASCYDSTCDSDLDCAALGPNAVCLSESESGLPDGMCTILCDGEVNCPQGTSCQPLMNRVREGYERETGSACLPACDDDSDCSRETGWCDKRYIGAGVPGACQHRCSFHADCDEGMRCQQPIEHGWPEMRLCVPATPTEALCGDHKDDDGDSYFDCEDSDCEDSAHCTENCFDNVDDDGDGFADCKDSQCDNPCEDCAYHSLFDDDDGDGLHDCIDPDCAGQPMQCTENVASACQDGGDNDRDGLIDCMDPNCVALGPNVCNETSEYLCSDGIDTDGDGLIDCQDPSCSAHCTEQTVATCTDQRDNDRDGVVDCRDPDCVQTVALCQENTVSRCADGIDNDYDGKADCSDPSCHTVGQCAENTHVRCHDGVDNDLDGFTDCVDPSCGYPGVLTCTERGTIGCGDGLDNDTDGVSDCDDPKCWCYEHCDDGVDNDENSTTDCADSRCLTSPLCEEICDDDIDNNRDGKADCRDLRCNAFPACIEVECDDAVDNDDNGKLDCDDPDCTASIFCVEDCKNEIDDDADSRIDCFDDECIRRFECLEAQHCEDGRDNDNDGREDCRDVDCAQATSCMESANCSDDIDNDEDGETDCEDSNCSGLIPCIAEICSNSADDDGDGTYDCADRDCEGEPSCDQIPPPLNTIAPPLDPSVPTTIYESMRFVYEGPNAIQHFVEAGTIRPQQASLVRGAVRDRSGDPLPAVRVTILNRPELGETRTDAEGMFTMVVNGGGKLVFHYEAAGFLDVQRSVELNWSEFTQTDDVVLTALDPNVTTVTLSGDEEDTRVARGAAETDERGTRQATLLIPPHLNAVMVMDDGTQQPLPSMDVRATEYTVGREGPDAMPGALPPFSAYTYAVELSVDEALLADAPRVQFSAPISLYVENFIGAPVGTTVPFGSCDRRRGVWLPESNGRVIQVIGSNGGLAVLDLNGTGVAATSLELVELGVSEGELRRLAELYAPGQELWRTTIDHFTPCDPNWVTELPAGALPPEQAQEDEDADRDCDEEAAGSILSCYRQSLGEAVPVAGAPFHLRYESSKFKGATSVGKPSLTIETNYTAPAVVPFFQIVNVDIAGQRFEHVMRGPLTYDFYFNGYDVAGRKVSGPQDARITLCNVYQIVRYPAVVETNEAWDRPVLPPDDRFGEPEYVQWTGCRTWNEAVDAPYPTTLNNWDISIHHTYDPLKKVVIKGDGGRQSVAGAAGPRGSAEQIIGHASECDYSCDPVNRTCGFNIFDCGHSYRPAFRGGDSLYMEDARDFDVHPDGSIFVLQTLGDFGSINDSPVINVVDSNDRARRVVGRNENCALNSNISCNGTLPATNMYLGESTEMAMGPDGLLYVASYYKNTTCKGMQIQRFSRDSMVIEQVAGANTCDPAADEDGLPATQARIRNVKGMSFGPEGSLYYGEGHRIRRITLSGTVFTVVGKQDPPPANVIPALTHYDALGAPDQTVRYALDTDLSYIRDFAITPLGEIYITASVGMLVYLPDGRLRLVGGGSGTYPEPSDAGNPIGAKISFQAVVVGRDGAVYTIGRKPKFGTWPLRHDDYVYKISGGRISIVTGGKSALNTKILMSTSASYWGKRLAFHPNGRLLILNNDSVVALAAEPIIGRRHTIPSADGSEIWVFDERGRHLETIDARTRSPIYRFEYGDDRRLEAIVDAVGNRTVIQRNALGLPTAIIPPFAEPTELEVGASGTLREIRSPGGATHLLSYHQDRPHLLATMTDPASQTFQFEFDDEGRITRDEDPAGGVQMLERTDVENGYEVVHRKSETTNPTVYRATTNADGSFTHRTTEPDGTFNESVQQPDGVVIHRQSDGTVIEATLVPDTRDGAMRPVPKLIRTRLPSGLTRVTQETRHYSNDVFGDLHTVEVQQTVGSDPARVVVHDVTARTQIIVSPEGRERTVYLDVHSRWIRAEIPGLAPIEMRYDLQGRLEWISAASGSQRRTTTFGYRSEDGYLGIVDGPLADDTRMLEPDADGRTERHIEPNASEVAMSFDGRGMLESLTPPSRGEHKFIFTPVGLTESYVPPATTGIGAGVPTVYEYDLERRLTELRRADGTSLTVTRDSATGRTTMVHGGTWEAVDPTEPHVTWSHFFEYHPVTGQLSKTTREDSLGSRDLTLSYDGALLTLEEWNGGTGGATGSVARIYDPHFRVDKLAVNGATVVDYGYDRDGLLISAGPLAIHRNIANGALTGTSIGAITTQEVVNVFGEFATSTVKMSSDRRYENVFTRDKLGRVASRVERTRTAEGALESVTIGYDYDAVGRLKEVFTNGAMRRSYDYDANGNRTAMTSTLGTIVGRYDGQDRLTRYCPENAAGEATPIVGLPCFEYLYRESGELQIKHDLAQDGVETRYLYDQLGALRSVELPDGRLVEYEIDAAGRRAGKRIDGVKVEGLLYQSLLAPIAQLDSANQVASVFVYGTRPNVPDYMIRSGRTYRFVVDQVGSVRFVIDAATGQTAQQLDYDEFGNVTTNVVSLPGFSQPFGFAGGLYDSDTGLTRFGARDYDPVVGRWTAKDPILFGGRSANLYAYCRNDPTNRTDPNGKNPIGATWAFIENWHGVSGDGVNDKFYHCMANCEAAALGPWGEATAEFWSDFREDNQDQPTNTSAEEDQAANRAGRDAGREICESGNGDDSYELCIEACHDQFGFVGDGNSTPKPWTNW